MNKSTHLGNTPVNNDVDDEPDGKKIMKLSDYMNKVCTNTYMFDGSIDSLNEPGITYVWIPPTSETKCGVNKKFSRNKLDCILKGNNTTVHQVDYM